MGGPFVVNVACDVGAAKVNTGIEFDGAPASLSDLIAVAEALYSAELRLQTGDPAAAFRCVACMALAADGAWAEVTDAGQLAAGQQLYMFDWASPPASQAPIPAVQFVVTAAQVLAAAARARSQSGSVPTPVSGPLAAPAPAAPAPPAAAPKREPAGMVHTPPASQRWPAAGAAPAPAAPAPRGVSEGQGRLTEEARAYLFEQLCRASGSASAISASVLRRVFTDNRMAFPTDAFSHIIGGRATLDRAAWATVEQRFGPVVEALYDRLVESTEAARDGTGAELAGMRQELRDLEEEEARLMARQAALRQRTAEVVRGIREGEARQAAREARLQEQAREAETLQHFVGLRLRQAKLREEEAQVAHQLSLL